MAIRQAWQFTEPGEPLARVEDELEPPDAGEVVVRVAGCGVCHTDLGFWTGDVPTRGALPLVLGHEISGTVVHAGESAEEWQGRDVLVPAVIPCGDCRMCRAGRGNVCPQQIMPGNDRDGGFASHVTVPARGLTPIDSLPDGYSLADFAVVADAVTTPLQAVRRAGVAEGDLVVVVGAGGIGTYAVQIASASGARVIAVDIDPARLEPLRQHGAMEVVDASGKEIRDVREAIRGRAGDLGYGRVGWKIFECSGTPAGQQTAFSLLGPAATLGVVGYTPEPTPVRLSNLMAFDADAFGSWGCPPERYPEAVALVREGEIDLLPFVRHMPLESIQEAFEIAEAATDPHRLILTPETPAA